MESTQLKEELKEKEDSISSLNKRLEADKNKIFLIESTN